MPTINKHVNIRPGVSEENITEDTEKCTNIHFYPGFLSEATAHFVLFLLTLFQLCYAFNLFLFIEKTDSYFPKAAKAAL